MPYIPSAEETRRLRKAIDRAAFSEAERIAWLLSFSAVLIAEAGLIALGPDPRAVAGVLGGFAVLYWRLRGGHLLRGEQEVDRQLHGAGLRTRDQRAFTALMLRYVFTGRNPLRPRFDHDPIALWNQRVERTQVVSEE